MVGVSDVQDSKDTNKSRNASMKTTDYDSGSIKGPKEVSFRQRPSIIDSLMVTKVEEPSIQCAIPENQDGNDLKNIESQPLRRDFTQDDYALYEEDLPAMPTLASFLASFTVPGQQDKRDKKKRAKLGLLLGVYLPTIQHIFGVLMFLRLFWIVGIAGIWQAFLLVFICCLCTFLTSMSMSAIATNGVVESGGSYFMLSRNLGPEFGSAVGILFYLANAFATAMYLVGGVEILLTYLAPSLPQFRDPDDPHSMQAMYNNYRVYASGLLFIEFLIVAAGVRVVQLFAPISLFAVITSIISIYIGSFVASPSDTDSYVCRVGETLIKTKFLASLSNASAPEAACNATVLQNYCSSVNISAFFCETVLTKNEPKWVSGIPGYGGGLITENMYGKYMTEKESIPDSGQGDPYIMVTQDITSSFFKLLAIYFPSVTGIMTGSNMSGDLADPQRSIPLGTIAAQLTTSFVYLSYVFVFGCTIITPLLRDKLGDSLGGGMVVAKLAWPSEWVLLIGSFLSTFGAALQCLCSAPRLLQSIAKDDVIPLLSPFAVVTRCNEPFRALLISTLLAEIGVLIGAIDAIAPVLDFFFLVCYAFVNFACFLQTILGAPNWRPRFRFYHWSLSLLGAALAIFIMFATHWDYALVSIALCALIYKYVEYRGAKKEWGDGIRGLALAGARYSLLNMDDEDMHTKNWRPQFLILAKLDEDDKPKYPRLMTLAGQLKAGRGLIMSAAVIIGDYADATVRARCKKVQQNLKKMMLDEKAKGFAQAIICTDEAEGISVLVQSSGVAALRPNTVIVGWPNSWKQDRNNPNYYNFLDAIHRVATTDKCLIIPKGITNFPDNSQRLINYIDVWWIIHDGGLLLLLPFLLRRHRVWRNCNLRLFAVATWKDDPQKMKNDLNRWLYQLRIDASVNIVELPDTDMTAYTFQKTLQMEERLQFLKELHLTDKEENPQIILDRLRVGSVRYSVLDHHHHTDAKEEESASSEQIAFNEYTFSPSISPLNAHFNLDDASTSTGTRMMSLPKSPTTTDGRLSPIVPSSPTVSKKNMKKMHSAVRLNEVIRERSKEACLVIVNLPGPPKHRTGLTNYLDYLEVLTDGLDRVLLVRGTGKEVITMYS